MNYHPIQKQILTKFLTHPELRYSEVRIPEIENDLFNYHLQYLVKIGILLKLDRTYSLSTKGLTDLLMFDSQGNIYQGLRVSVLVYVIDYHSKPHCILAQKHIRQPYLGDFNAGISGKANGITRDAPIPDIIPQKYPCPFNLHQYHFKTFDAVYPPYNALTIHNVTWFIELTRKPKIKPTITNAIVVI